MKDKVMRLTPAGDVCRELYLKSGNWCCYPGCHENLMDQKGVFLGEICHIEAASEDGPRFNSSQTNEERRSFSNLILLCRKHHKVIDDKKNQSSYPVNLLKGWKQIHENKFTDLSQKMLITYKDFADFTECLLPKNLNGMNEALEWELGDEELSVSLNEFLEYVSQLKKVPPAYRSIYARMLNRAYPASFNNYEVVLSEVVEACPELTIDAMRQALSSLVRLGLGRVEEEENGFRQEVFTFSRSIESDWCIAKDLHEFSKKSKIPLDTLVHRLDFSSLD